MDEYGFAPDVAGVPGCDRRATAPFPKVRPSYVNQGQISSSQADGLSRPTHTSSTLLLFGAAHAPVFASAAQPATWHRCAPPPSPKKAASLPLRRAWSREACTIMKRGELIGRNLQ
ncbi:hypothetical protein A0H81_07230 [Grifola frondosa]|uniref:Uncharacterized protein n=1 Tax=Grifola frondosa TaxID=5627 RepID=A0A1C7M8U6_GRIFR|nr:hypothetical protein A0H81_07230 [Grifola frondosa]